MATYSVSDRPVSSDFEISLSREERRLCAVFGVGWCVFCLVLAVVFAASGSWFALVPLIGGLVGGWIATRVLHVAVVARGDELVVRNYLRGHRVERSVITDFAVVLRHDGLFRWPSHLIEARLASGKAIPLKATRRAWFLPGGASKLSPQLAELTEWSHGGEAPTDQ